MTIYVQGIHTVRPLLGDVFDRWVDFYGNDVLPRMARHGFDAVGGWKRDTGRLNQDLLLIRFASLEDYGKASASLANDTEFGKAIGLILREMRIEEEITIGNPVPYADDTRLDRALAEKPATPRTYLHATIPVQLGRSPRAHKNIGELVSALDARGGGMKLVAAYESATGVRGVINDFWALPEGPVDLSYRRSGGPNELIAGLREVAPEEDFHYLSPLPYSPLQ